ncbi:hypothetical protein [Streptomyces sp. NPDC095613]|uniref:hypothetical protein n=1 Tax=Streptomyces sp. NPDC095613 TaxID=3155540 RepID=UPI0033228F0A
MARYTENQRAFLAGAPKPRRPSKPWRVLVSTPTHSTRTDYRSSQAAYEHVVSERQKAETGVTDTTAIRVLQWVDGDWDLYERITPNRTTEK